MFLNNLQSFIIVTLFVQINHVASQVIGSTCNSSSGSQLWKYNQSTGQLQSSSPGEPCLTMSSYPGDGTQLLMSPCSSGSELQAFDFITGNLIVARVAPTKCVNLAGYGTSPGTIVWIYGCVGQGYTCEGNCDWISLSGSSYQNPESKLCLDDGYAPPLLHTCEPGSPSFNLPFCNYTLSRDERIKDLVSRLPLPYKLSLFALPLPVSLPALVNESLSLAAFNWDITTIHGLSSTYFISPLPNATMFPHAIAQGSSFDVDLAVRIAKAVSYEARAVSQRNFRLSNGRSVQALNSEGGPLANSCHHPGWGRAMETYGEDPHLIATMGTAITLAMQNETNGFLQLSSVTRHYLGYHGATDLPNSGEEWVTEQWFRDQHLPAYESYLTIGKSEGVMCSCNTLRVGEGDGPEGGIPACVHPLLYDILRNEWNSTCFVQGDNEAILPMVSDHHYYKTLEEAVVGALSAGVVAVDSGANADIIAALASALQDGTATIEQLDVAVSRQFEMRFKVGEFDTNNTNNPFRLEYDESQIDGPAHRALAREAVAKSLILLKNDNQVLPLSSSNPPSSIAVIGPWANVNDTRGDYGCYNTYAGNYATQTSVVSTISDAIAEAVGLKSSVTYALGSNPYTLSSPTGIADSALLASQSEVTVLVLGLGCSIEAEGVDRPNLYLPSVQDELFASVSLAVQNRRAAGQAGVLILVTVSANIADVNEDGADAWIQLMIPGEEAGHGFVDILFGSASPSGRLPLTSYTNDYFNVCGPIADFNMISDTTGIGRTYRFAEYIPQGMIKHHFGFGLSYSSFTYSGLQLVELSDGSINVTFAVANVGSFSPAREVSQVYVQVPQIDGLITPTIQLRGFDVVSLSSGNEPTSVTIQLPFPKAFATTMKNGSSIVTGGEYTVYVSGHQPNDIEGSLQSNVLKGVVRK